MMDIASVRQNWRQRGFSCDLWVDPPGQCWERYVHATDELVMVVEGEVEFEVAGVIHQPWPGEDSSSPPGPCIPCVIAARARPDGCMVMGVNKDTRDTFRSGGGEIPYCAPESRGRMARRTDPFMPVSLAESQCAALEEPQDAMIFPAK